MSLPFRIATLLYCFNEAGEILLQHRTREPNLGLWSPPGGKLETEKGESPYACARREAREEIGLELEPSQLRLMGIVSEHGDEGTAHWLMFLFEVLPRLRHGPPPHPEGRFAFFPIDQIATLSLPQTDREQIWPMIWRHRGGFFAAHCHISAEGEHDWRLEESQPLEPAGSVSFHSPFSILDCPDDNYFMGEALRQARRAYQAGETPVGAVITRENRIIARAHNQVELLKDATAHAEMLAITQAEEAVGDWRLNDCSLYVTKEPCAMCAGAMVHARVGRVVFGAADPKAGSAGGALNLLQFPTFNHRCATLGGVREPECRSLLSDFFRERRAAKKEVTTSGDPASSTHGQE